ncbi:MAG: hypothetical protein AB1487_09865 [Thermodesulfobacteriota bacterium]
MTKEQKEKKYEKLTADDEVILRAAKEIVIKFIETGRVSPANFEENFRRIYSGIRDTVLGPSR